jgi:LysM repeat protein
MRARWWVLFIGLNVVVSVLTTLAVLELKGEAEKVVIVTATPAAGLVSQAPTQAPTPQITGPTPSPTTPADAGYTVQPGDTLGGIALANGVALENLLSANGLTENDVIQPGQTLVIPIGTYALSYGNPDPAWPGAGAHSGAISPRRVAA